MSIKACTTLTYTGETPDIAALAGKLASAQMPQLKDIPAMAELVVGWSPAEPGDDRLLRDIGGDFWCLSLSIYAKRVPAAEITRKTADLCAEIERQTGRPPGRKARRELKDDALTALLPQAFPKIKATPVVIDIRHQRVHVASASSAVVDRVLTALAEAAPRMNLALLQTAHSVSAVMAGWLAGGGHDGIDLEPRLTIGGENGEVLSLRGIDPESEDVAERLRGGMEPRHLGVTFHGRLYGVLDHRATLSSLSFLGSGQEHDGADEREAWEAKTYIAGQELRAAYNSLIAECGGVAELPIEAAANAAGGGEP